MFFSHIISLIEKPYAKKPYLDLINYLKSINREQEAEAFLELFQLRFTKNDNNVSDGSE
jgi:hypothetical protein